ncbi:hypothetical protein EVAR_98806_1 [Eumeta japonica]|uniref:Uncharacterized protein n=1 Tax=Eumeta variegata TaxID=151549 RepID=A0A4C1XV46_EUMVA|nr:hypothetical protein EVAR_98806_1 [Eumeta japonica]
MNGVGSVAESVSIERDFQLGRIKPLALCIGKHDIKPRVPDLNIPLATAVVSSSRHTRRANAGTPRSETKYRDGECANSGFKNLSQRLERPPPVTVKNRSMPCLIITRDLWDLASSMHLYISGALATNGYLLFLNMNEDRRGQPHADDEPSKTAVTVPFDKQS